MPVVSAAYDTDEGIATATSRRSGRRARKFFKKCITLFRFQVYNSEEDVSHLYRWRVPNLLTGGEHISPASLKRQEEVLPAAKLEQWRYKEQKEEIKRLRLNDTKG